MGKRAWGWGVCKEGGEGLGSPWGAGELHPPLRPCVSPSPSPAELAKMYKNEGNEYFREKDYRGAVIAYSEGLKKKCEDPELNAVLHTNRGAAQFYLGKETWAVLPLTELRRGLAPVGGIPVLSVLALSSLFLAPLVS